MLGPSAIVSHISDIAELTANKENRLLKRVSTIGAQLGLQHFQEGRHKVVAESRQNIGCSTQSPHQRGVSESCTV